MRLKRAAAAISGLVFLSLAGAGDIQPTPQGPWQPVAGYTSGAILLATRPMSGTNVHAFRAETVVDSSLSTLVAVVSDFSHLPAWMPHVAKVEETAKIDAMHSRAYVVIHSPWPLHDRDVFIDARISQDKSTGVVRVSSHSYPAGPGLQAGCVRMPEMDTDWTFTPLPDHHVKVVLRGFGLPGGVVPDWAANLVITELPYGSLKHLPEQIGMAAYRHAHVAGISEPLH